MTLSSSSAFRMLHGIFVIYKPPGIKWKSVRDTVEIKLLQELNSLKQPPAQQKILFLPQKNGSSCGGELTKVVTSVPALADHKLVKGPSYTHLKIGVGHKLDTKSSGVFVLGIRNGNKLLTDMYEKHYTKDYTVSGMFGKATDDFSDVGKVIEKTTYKHITRERLEQVLAMIQGANQKALLMHSHVDLKSQEAYEMAVQGSLKPMVKSPPLILGVRCIDFSLPNFTLEIQCMHETQQYLRKLIHEIGLELRSSAVCTKVRRTRDGPFTLDCALTHGHWDLNSITNAIKECRPIATELCKDNASLIWENQDKEDGLGIEERSIQ
ncbi:pseudouridylate synthase TRUB2, mitochondrial [Hyla sarda]|uniref:pseudouridylate synthase TRUB2, mitochondrial n=1 Tax=Hyla sarda TaxID=327740 RepID=UPI0024C26A8F|nr:pseudouridylate synthase TRUB2, mitochondrial [Hyla sarda]XP_056391983.1 pseudouridylate synthase TRUB2, mitochondrial [Hyla sarda]XP_056391984.1 pseudouridylate synthase TRUB2, mitochondrial [Hyla sarda]XP_056391985.1 pseudouridylate synthase TRUB2, mitochondrial [Hyla sarda]